MLTARCLLLRLLLSYISFSFIFLNLFCNTTLHVHFPGQRALHYPNKNCMCNVGGQSSTNWQQQDIQITNWKDEEWGRTGWGASQHHAQTPRPHQNRWHSWGLSWANKVEDLNEKGKGRTSWTLEHVQLSLNIPASYDWSYHRHNRFFDQHPANQSLLPFVVWLQHAHSSTISMNCPSSFWGFSLILVAGAKALVNSSQLWTGLNSFTALPSTHFGPSTSQSISLVFDIFWLAPTLGIFVPCHHSDTPRQKHIAVDRRPQRSMPTSQAVLVAEIVTVSSGSPRFRAYSTWSCHQWMAASGPHLLVVGASLEGQQPHRWSPYASSIMTCALPRPRLTDKLPFLFRRFSCSHASWQSFNRSTATFPLFVISADHSIMLLSRAAYHAWHAGGEQRKIENKVAIGNAILLEPFTVWNVQLQSSSLECNSHRQWRLFHHLLN